MTALAQGSAGLALVTCFGLLCTGQLSTAAALLVAQSVAVAVVAAILNHPLIAIPPLLLGGGIWLVRHETPLLESRTAPAGGAKLGIGVGALLAILCQSQAGIGLPLAIVLLSILLAATRSHPLMQVIALVALQNGLALAACLIAGPGIMPAAVRLSAALVLLPLPLAAGLLVPAIASSPHREPAREEVASRVTAWLTSPPRTMRWLESTDLFLALAIFVASLVLPLDSLASTFAPLLALDGVLQSCRRWNRKRLTPARRVLALAQTGFSILAVCVPDPVIAWLAVLAAMAVALLPALLRRWSGAVLAFLAGGLALLGLMMPPVAPAIAGALSSAGTASVAGVPPAAAALPVVGALAMSAGFAMIAAVVPELSAVLVILLLRSAIGTPWPPAGLAIGAGVAIIALLVCAASLAMRSRAHRTTYLQLSMASIAALAMFAGQADGRFAALVLLVLLILARSAARFRHGAAAVLATAGLGGTSPLGVLPGLALVVLAMSAHAPWLLLPIGVAMVPIALASLPRQVPALASRPSLELLAWLPLLLAALAGYFAPEGLAQWWHLLTAGRA